VKTVGGLEQDHHHEAENQQRYGESRSGIEMCEHLETFTPDRDNGIARPVGAHR